ncbi:MAG: DUF4230 domain-containing protein [Chloroflexota bacterium]|nr:DUF4230 domain-containing protein [Chloroflexota bacterium]
MTENTYLPSGDQSDPQPPPQKRGSVLPWVLLALVLIPALACGFFTVATVGSANQASNLLQDLLNGGELVVRSDRTGEVIMQIQDLGRLETASYTVEKVIEGGVGQENTLLDLLLGDRLLLIAHGQVIAGVDLAELTAQDIRISDDRLEITVQLPASRILTHRLDNEKSYVYDRQQGFLTKGDPHLETEVRRVAERRLLEAACNGGILAKAEENAQRQLKILLQAMEFDNVEFVAPRPVGNTGCE